MSIMDEVQITGVSGCANMTTGTGSSPTYNPYRHIEVEPSTCKGKAHVFACEHVESCDCGAIRRVMPQAKKAKAGRAR